MNKQKDRLRLAEDRESMKDTGSGVDFEQDMTFKVKRIAIGT